MMRRMENRIDWLVAECCKNEGKGATVVTEKLVQDNGMCEKNRKQIMARVRKKLR